MLVYQRVTSPPLFLGEKSPTVTVKTTLFFRPQFEIRDRRQRQSLVVKILFWPKKRAKKKGKGVAQTPYKP